MRHSAAALLFRFLLLIGLLFAGGVPAQDAAPPAPALALPAPGELHVYVREGCPHCADAKRFLAELASSRPGLEVVLRQVDRDPAARDALVAISEAVGAWPPGVPTFVYGQQVVVGFDDAEHVGSEILRLLDEAPPPPRDRVQSGLFGTLSASELGLPLFTLAIGLLDGFNPCAMWVLLFLLSLLVRLKDRRRMAAVAGTFVLASGAVYYAFMAAWLNVFLFVGMTETLRIGLAALAMLIGLINVKDFFAFRRGLSLSIPESAKPGLYARARAILKADSLPASIAAVAVLAVVVNFVELLCTAGLPAVYTAVLTQHALSPLAHYGYLGLYILAYIADDALMVGTAVLALGSGKLDERGGRRLKLLSGAVMLVLGLVMLLRPDWLM
ncbi:MAG: glutaredoxin family protein [Thauera sp.]